MGLQRVGKDLVTKPPPPVEGKRENVTSKLLIWKHGNMFLGVFAERPALWAAGLSNGRSCHGAAWRRQQLWTKNQDAGFRFWRLPVLKTHSSPSDSELPFSHLQNWGNKKWGSQSWSLCLAMGGLAESRGHSCWCYAGTWEAAIDNHYFVSHFVFLSCSFFSFLAAQHLSPPTRVQTRVPCSGSSES